MFFENRTYRIWKKGFSHSCLVGNQVFVMVKTVLKIDGMMCSMCESHMNDLIRNHCKVKKVSSSAGKGETVVISENELDLAMLEKEIEGIGYHLLSSHVEPYVKKGLFSFGK